MGSVRVMSDSTCDLSPELTEKHGISIVPLYVIFNGDSYRDGIDIKTDELYKIVERLNILPRTSAPSPSDFCKAFSNYIEKGEDIIYIGLSSELSATVQNARIAAQEFPEGRIEVIDSRNLSTGIGLLVMKAVDFAEKGLGVSEIAENIRGLVPQVRTRFVINTLDYLCKGGRCTALESFIGGLLNIRPIIAVEEGRMILEEKIRGKKEKALKSMLENTLADRDIIDTRRVFVTHSLAEEEAVYLKSVLEQRLEGTEIITASAGCVISSHCGRGTTGILYMRSREV
ncbi:MAG TPA: DegV family protein [Bacillota bacterium]|nr:DegV family protein [Bacillota bacterium]